MTTDRLFPKYRVERTDGRDKPGGDKAGARYFVLDYVHDEHARAALKAYADACERDEPGLAADLRRELAATVAPPSEPAPAATSMPAGFGMPATSPATVVITTSPTQPAGSYYGALMEYMAACRRQHGGLR